MNKSTINSAKLIDTTYFSIGFPNEIWDDLIYRENYISQIKEYLSKDIKILFIEGDEDSGKTTVCAQFAKKFINHTITVFFNPHNVLDFKLEFFYSNVVAQIRHILGEAIDLDENESYVTIEQYRQYIFQLRKLLKKKNDKMYLIIDGLEARTKDQQEFIKLLFDILPIGQDIFRIIISGSFNEFIKLFTKPSKQEIKAITITGFSKLEIIEYLGIKTSDYEISDIFKITNGLPGRLRTLKRLLITENYSLDKINESTTYRSWVEIDCESVDLDNPKINFVISLLALYEKTFNIEELSTLLSIERDQTESLIKGISIIESNGNTFNFVSNAHRKYYANVLRGNKKQIDDLLMKFYIKENNINSKLELTKLYVEKDQWDKVIETVDDRYLQQILETTGNIKKVNESIDFGLIASERSSKFIDMYKYSVQGSIVNELDNYLFWESEINARISINDFKGAISLAESAILKVDRFRLLSLIARKQKEQNNKVDEDLINLIKELYQQTEITGIGEIIYEIVADLIYSIPNLAIELIEKSSGNTSEKNINDWIIAKLSIAAIDSNNRDSDDATKEKK